MKRKLAGVLSVFMIATMISSCGILGAKQNEESPAVESSTEDTGLQGEGEETPDSGEAVSAEAGEGDSATAEASFDPAEIVEPEIVEEEVVNPVPTDAAQEASTEAAETAESVEAPAPEEPAVDDTLDVVFFGDSQFDNARDTGSEVPMYTQALLQGKKKIYNLAIGGTPASLERGSSPDVSGWTDTCFVGLAYALAGKVDRSILDPHPAIKEQMEQINPANVDFYVIEYGANDYINGKDLWNPDDQYDVHTYKGALAVGINVLKEISPKAQFILCGPSYCMWYNADGFAIGDSYTVSKGIGTLSEYADICNNLADEEGITYVDTMYATYFDLRTTTVDDYLSDGLHYKESGRQIYATTIAHFINKALGIDPEPLSFMEINNFQFGQ